MSQGQRSPSLPLLCQLLGFAQHPGVSYWVSWGHCMAHPTLWRIQSPKSIPTYSSLRGSIRYRTTRCNPADLRQNDQTQAVVAGRGWADRLRPPVLQGLNGRSGSQRSGNPEILSAAGRAVIRRQREEPSSRVEPSWSQHRKETPGHYPRGSRSLGRPCRTCLHRTLPQRGTMRR